MADLATAGGLESQLPVLTIRRVTGNTYDLRVAVVRKRVGGEWERGGERGGRKAGPVGRISRREDVPLAAGNIVVAKHRALQRPSRVERDGRRQGTAACLASRHRLVASRAVARVDAGLVRFVAERA